MSFIIGLCVRVLNALDLVHFIMGHHKLVQPKMGSSWRGGAGRGLPPAPHLEPPMHQMPDFSLEMHQIQFSAGAQPQTLLGAHSAPQTSYLDLEKRKKRRNEKGRKREMGEKGKG